jgi:hypothetical protein
MRNICKYFEYRGTKALQIERVQIYERDAADAVALGKNFVATFSRVYELVSVGGKIEAYIYAKYIPKYGVGLVKRGRLFYFNKEHIDRLLNKECLTK